VIILSGLEIFDLSILMPFYSHSHTSTLYRSLLPKQKRKRSEGKEKVRSQQLVRVSKALRNPIIAGTGINSETGRRRADQILNTRGQAVAQGLQKHTCLDLNDDATSRVGLMPVRAECEILNFNYDPDTEGLLLGISQIGTTELDQLVSVLPNDNSTWPALYLPSNTNNDDSMRTHYSFAKLRPMHHFQSNISSISLSPSRTLITTTLGSSYPASIHLTQLLDPWNAVSSQPLDTGISTLMRPLAVSSIWTASPNPHCTSSNETVAVGTSNGLITIDNSTGTWRCSPLVETHSDVLALDWLSPTTLAAGLRDSSIMLYDSRNRDSIKRLRHGAPVIGVRRGDHESRLVVCGLSSCLAMYDLRMIREAVSSSTTKPAVNNNNQHKKQKNRWKRQPIDLVRNPTSMPVVQFEYNNQYQHPLGFDVQNELGIVAAAEETGNVQIYSMRTGEKVRKLEIASGGLTGEHVKSLRFVEDVRGVQKIMATAGSKIVEYCW
jgi:hypothetical protein